MKTEKELRTEARQWVRNLPESRAFRHAMWVEAAQILILWIVIAVLCAVLWRLGH